MKLAVMQPYLFPYIGYFQLVNCVDLFILYDDVNYIQRGYINRNSILLNRSAHRFTVPVINASQNRKISELSFSNEIDKTLKSISHAYSKAPFFNEIYLLISDVLTSSNRDISFMCELAISRIFNYLDLPVKTIHASTIDYDRDLSAQDRLISLCNMFGAKEYVNSIGGKSLYKKEDFLRNGITLHFIETQVLSYNQRTDNFIPNLSIIDTLMWCSIDKVHHLLNMYRLS
ncbi:MAG: WbqC family protein [Candidatus Thiodiazotropha sp.]